MVRAAAAPPLRRVGTFRVGSRSKLTPRDAPHFASLPPLLGEVADAVSSAACLPRKELFEAWEVATRIDAAFPSASRVADLAAGHGLLSWMLLLLARSRGHARTAVCVDATMPPSSEALATCFLDAWPELEPSWDYVEAPLICTVGAKTASGGRDSTVDCGGVLLASIHACGALTDEVLRLAVAGRSPVAVMPCCHSLRKHGLGAGRDAELAAAAAALGGPAAAIDSLRIDGLRDAGYRVETSSIPHEITPKNRLILGSPLPSAAAPVAVSASALRLADPAASRAAAGRKPTEWVHTVDLSAWTERGPALSAAALRDLALRAVAADGDDADVEIGVEAELFEVWRDETSGRTAHNWRVIFSAAGAAAEVGGGALSRREAGAWLRRMRADLTESGVELR